MKAYWRDVETSVATAEELRLLVAKVQQLGEPTILFLEQDGKATLAIGLGGKESVLTYSEPDGRSFHSLGDPTRTERLRFWCRDQMDEFMAEMAIPEPDAVSAAFEFLLSGARPANVKWEADW
jgi:hypothetical protein